MKHIISYIYFDNILQIKNLKILQNHLENKIFDGNPIETYNIYPFIQYKILKHKLFIVALDKYGLTFVDKIINQKITSFILEKNEQKLEIIKLNVCNFYPKFLNKQISYIIDNYIPFRSVSYINFRSLSENKDKQKEYIARFLKQHILQFMHYMDMDLKEFNEKFYLDIISIEEKKTRLLYKTMLKPFFIKFKTNLLLPNYIGLGRLNKLGFGNIKLIEQY